MLDIFWTMWAQTTEAVSQLTDDSGEVLGFNYFMCLEITEGF